MQRRRGIIYVLTIAAIFVMFAVEVNAFESTFHGYFESNFVLRDTTGLQYGFMDQVEGVQQRNTLKFDVDIYPDASAGDFSISKVHLTFRGAYDSIYDFRANEYGDIKDNLGASRFDYGRKDVKFESDLREAFADLCYNGFLGSAFLRPGRQIVSWGEAGGISTIMDIINPKDQSYQMFFQKPDDVKIPLWMGRLNYSTPAMKGLALNFDLLWVPDIRPAQFGPFDSVAGNRSVGLQAPYIKILPFGSFVGADVRQKVPTEEQEYGAKVTADIGDRLSVSAAYYRDVNNDFGAVISHMSGGVPVTLANVFARIPPDEYLLTHNVQHVYGSYFSYNIAELDLVIRGEIARHTGEPISLNTRYFRNTPDGLATFAYRPVTRWYLAADKKIKVPFITDHERTSFGFEWAHEKINEWDGALFNKSESSKTGSKVRDLDIFGFSVSWSWWEGRIAPYFLVYYNPGRPGAGGGSAMIHPEVTWQISSNLYANMGLQAFFGDKTSRSSYAGLVPTSEMTFKLGYNW
ncbi:MAG: hypothetical protein FP814_11475 [Desulfobacterium sp.]|nr:hypothetical protein [Desulfobacterium sp.]MBU3948023.1 DUF1302 domain-containing protein [Pseudomonadota bacterium]MBU4009548.1 DUF1302 domain-containing protein [Pseudomonadota bacterium]MBU4037992.1 DUF1302 domain-containing protein [Pseudomonadota bacterium]